MNSEGESCHCGKLHLPFAAAARKGAPQARQVADRFHLVKNVVEAIEAAVSRCYKQIRQAQAPLPSAALPKAKEWRQAPAATAERKRLARLAHNQERYAQVIELQRRGVKQEEMAQRLRISKRTLQGWLERDACPGSQPRRKRRSIFDPSTPYVLSRWQQGCRDVSLLWQDIQAQGFSGKRRTVYRFIRTLRQGSAELPAPAVLARVSVQEALWLIVRPLDALKADERAALQELCQASQELANLHTLVQSFGQIVRKREGQRLPDGITQVTDSGLPEVPRFAKGRERDKAAVLAGLTLVHANGQLEGQVNKLKLIKRMMYGRAGFPLLRQRVLHAA